MRPPYAQFAAGMSQFNTTQARFELRLASKSESKPCNITLDKAGVAGATLLDCFIHGAMRSYIFARDSLRAAKTTPDGQAVLKNRPRA